MNQFYSSCFNSDDDYSSTNEELVENDFENNSTLSFTYNDFNSFYNIFEPIHTSLSIILCCSGLLANGVTVAVLMRPNMISMINSLLTAVAISDSCLLISYLTFVSHYKFVSQCPADYFTYNWTIFALVHANASVVLRATSLWLSVFVAGHRKTVLYLNQPHVAHENFSLAVRSVFLIFISVTLIATPIFLGNSISEEMVPPDPSCNNETAMYFYRVVLSPYALSHNCFLMKVNNFINAVLLKLLPLTFLTYYLISIIVFICKRNQFHRLLTERRPDCGHNQSKNSNTTNNNTTKRQNIICGCWKVSSCSQLNSLQFHPTTIILSAILLMTIICEMPNAVTSAASVVMPGEFYWWVYRNLGDVFDLLSLFNGLTTFLMYCIMSSSFRTTFVQLLSIQQRRQSRAAVISSYDVDHDNNYHVVSKKFKRSADEFNKSNFNKRLTAPKAVEERDDDIYENGEDKEEGSVLISKDVSTMKKLTTSPMEVV